MNKKILVIEDEADISKLLELRLKSLGFKVYAIADTSNALSVIEKNSPDLIILDLLLPIERGEVFCKQLKSDPRYKNIPVILFTASSCNILDRVKDAGAEDGIIKPFEPDELISKINRFIS